VTDVAVTSQARSSPQLAQDGRYDAFLSYPRKDREAAQLLGCCASGGPVSPPRSAAIRRSRPVRPSVLADAMRDLLDPPAQLTVLLVLQDLVAIERVLESFQLFLQALQARLERLQPVL
jgi:hypothetical protein